MTFVIQENSTGWQPIANTDTVQRHPLGTIVKASDPTYGSGQFIYLKGVANTAVGSWATISMDDGTTTLTVADAVGPVGVAMSANVASQYGWYQIYGKAVGKVLASFADNATVFLTSTAGSVDDAVVDGDMVHNCLGASAIGTPSAGLAEMEIAFPYTDNITTND